MSSQFQHEKRPRSAGAASSSPVLRRNARTAEAAAAPARMAPGSDFTRIPIFGSLGDVLTPAARALADALVHFPSPLPDEHHTGALTRSDGIHVSARAAALPDAEFDRLLAHEAGHVAQQRTGTRAASTPELEAEAQALAPAVLAGQDVQARGAAPVNAVLADTPPTKEAVDRAKKRLALLRTFVNQWTQREARRLDTKALLDKRSKMDIPEEKGQRERMEAQKLAQLNRDPLDIKITASEVRFHVRFHVRFEDPKMRNRFDELKGRLEAGIRMVWNTNLTGEIFGGRSFVIEPEIVEVDAKAARNKKFWLITVRPTDKSPVAYTGCKLDQPPAGVPTAVTDSNCDGGVMSIPPVAIPDAFTFGHELLHLFGLVDRYLMVTQGKPPVTITVPSRETNNRPDPLGDEPGTILQEDLGFVFQGLGLYAQEEGRGLDTLKQLEDAGMTIMEAREDIKVQEAIIGGNAPRQPLYKPRKEYIDKIEQQLEDL